jgi:plasmid replication initiation protein
MSIDEKSLTVRQSNTLIEASYKIASVGEGRLIRALIGQIQPTDEDFKYYRVSVSDFARLFDITDQTAYEQIKKAADELTGRKIKIEKGQSWLFMNWLSSAEYIQGNGYVELCFDKKLKPYLLQLKGYFTQYELENVVTFRSSYSIRLYELLKAEQFKAGKTGKFSKTFEYESLRQTLAIADNEYSQFAFFRVNVIEIAVREINATSNLEITQIDYPKTGRKISHIVFHCEQARQTRLDVDGPAPVIEAVAKEREHPEDVRDLIAMGIDEATAYKWRKKYGVMRLTRNLAYTRAMQKAEKIRDSLTGFLARAIADNLGSAWEEEEKQRRAVIQAKNQVEAQKRTEEEWRALQDAERRAVLLHEFDTLSPEEKERVRSAYIEQATDIVRSVWEKAKKSLPDAPETDKRVLVSFLSFFSKWRETGMVTG